MKTKKFWVVTYENPYTKQKERKEFKGYPILERVKAVAFGQKKYEEFYRRVPIEIYLERNGKKIKTEAVRKW